MLDFTNNRYLAVLDFFCGLDGLPPNSIVIHSESTSPRQLILTDIFGQLVIKYDETCPDELGLDFEIDTVPSMHIYALARSGEFKIPDQALHDLKCFQEAAAIVISKLGVEGWVEFMASSKLTIQEVMAKATVH